MTDEDEYEDRMFESVIEALDFNLILKLMRAEYLRGRSEGHAAGYEAARADILADLETVAKRTKALMPPADRKPLAVTAMEPVDRPETDQLTNAPLGGTLNPGDVISDPGGPLDGHTIGPVEAREAPEATPAAPEPEKRTTEPLRPEERPPAKNLGGRPSKLRPPNIPSNLEMVTEALRELGPSSAPQVRGYVRKKWWPEASDYWSSCLYDLVDSGKLARQGMNFVIAPPKPVEQKPTPQEIINVEVAKRQAPKLGPPARQDGVDFAWNGKTVTLHQREATIAVQLRLAMNKGHLDAKLLANSIGIKSEAESVMRDMVSILNPKIAEIGLRVDYFKGFGFVMKEV